jgi:hypothetical protein
MSDRFDVVTFKETQNGKTFAVRLGSAVKSKKGDGWNLYLDAMPAPVDGQFRLSVVPPRERQDGDSGGSRGGSPRAQNPDDSIPF